MDALSAALCVMQALEQIRALPPDKFGAIIAALQDNGGDALARVLVGPLPFDGDET